MLRTPFHSRVAAACESNDWSCWKAYTTPRSYTDTELEYFAIRNSAGVFDLSPMLKYRIRGPEAGACLERLMTRDLSKLGVGRVGYSVWCNEAGEVMDDGTLFHLAQNDYRLCAYTPALDWLHWSALGFEVQVEEETGAVAALALQGPTSCAVLLALGLEGVEQLRPFDHAQFDLGGDALLVSRTGFTGDLGYELWVEPGAAERLWDRLFDAGRPYMIRPVGGAAYDLARIEAGFLQAGVDFNPAEYTVRTGRGSTPFELGLGWLVDFDKPVFNGRRALLEARRAGGGRRLALLDVAGNKPAHHAFVYAGRTRVGNVTSAAWCPTIKANFALASVDCYHARVGASLKAEIYYQRELQWSRIMADCRVLERPLFNPPRRRQTPAPLF
jgi:aminomethyltransferase